jgi:hypothetical protein
MLVCEECRIVDQSAGTRWIALLVSGNGPSDPPVVATYCPSCAETHFQYFSLRRRGL